MDVSTQGVIHGLPSVSVKRAAQDAMHHECIQNNTHTYTHKSIMQFVSFSDNSTRREHNSRRMLE